MSDETYNDLMVFVPEADLEELMEITGFGESEILEDYVLYCHMADLAADLKSWIDYKNETESFF